MREKTGQRTLRYQVLLTKGAEEHLARQAREAFGNMLKVIRRQQPAPVVVTMGMEDEGEEEEDEDSLLVDALHSAVRLGLDEVAAPLRLLLKTRLTTAEPGGAFFEMFH